MDSKPQLNKPGGPRLWRPFDISESIGDTSSPFEGKSFVIDIPQELPHQAELLWSEVDVVGDISPQGKNTVTKQCDSCQRVNGATLKVTPELHPIPVPNKVWHQIGVDLITLPEVDGYKYVVVAIDYFSKWSEAKKLKDKRASTIARFLWELVTRHGCFRVQINDQGTEFVNEVVNDLFRRLGVNQQISAAYHPQTNGLVERQNRTVKNALLKVLLDKVGRWPEVLDGVMFAHRVSKHASTGFSPFEMLYQRKPRLPVDLLQEEPVPVQEEPAGYTNGEQEKEGEPFDKAVFDKVLAEMTDLREEMEDTASKNIKKAQERQRKAYADKHQVSNPFKVGDQVLVRNLRRETRKGGWSQLPWKGPYTIVHIANNKTCTLRNNEGTVLKQKQVVQNLKHYFEQHNPNSERNTDSDQEEIYREKLTLEPEEKPQVELGMVKTEQSFPKRCHGSDVAETSCKEEDKKVCLIPEKKRKVKFGGTEVPGAERVPGKIKSMPYGLKLNDKDIEEVKSGIMLSDRHMDLASFLLKRQFPDIQGLQSTLLCQLRSGFQAVDEKADNVQFLYTGNHHWIVAVVPRAAKDVYLFDSVPGLGRTEVVKKSVHNMMKEKANFKEIWLECSRQPPNSLDCGLYAIANATDFCFNRKLKAGNFQNKEMRNHFLVCLREGAVQPFPKE